MVGMEIKESPQTPVWSKEITSFQVHTPTADFIGKIRIQRSIHLPVYIEMQSITDILCITTEAKQAGYHKCQNILSLRNERASPIVGQKEVHLGSPWNAALTFKKKSGRLPPRKKSSAHSQFQADSSY